MRKRALISGLYAIVDNAWNPSENLATLAGDYLRGGCRLIQLRIKPKSSSQDDVANAKDQMFVVACRVVALKRDYDFTLIINDHADIAAEVGADGVHVGNNDESIADIRNRYGNSIIVGYSSHSVEEAKWAEDMGADYVAFGAIYQTKTKGPGHPVQGIPKLKSVVEAADIPTVAIGGIDKSNIGEIVNTGVSSVAMISALAEAGDVVAEVQAYTKFFDEFNGCGFEARDA